MPKPEQSSRQRLLFFALLLEGGLGVAAIVLGWLIGLPVQDSVRVSPKALVWGLGAAGPMLVLMLICVKLPWQPLKEIARVVDEVIVPLFRPFSLPELALVAALAGWGEELLFRGLVQGGIAQGLGGVWGPWTGLILGSLLFGLAHPITAGYFVLAAVMGLYLGGLWMATDNLLVPMLAHGAYDFVALVYLVRFHGRVRPNP